MLDSEKQTILKSGLTAGDKTKKIAEIEKEYINKYASDMEIGEKPLDTKYLAEKFPTAWKETILDSEATKNPELKKVREKILEKVSDETQKIQGESATDYQQRLLMSLQKQTGLTLTPAEFEKFM